MKRIQIISLLFICTFSFNLASAQTLSHKVIKIIDGDTVYVDFNDNGIAEQNEKVRINGIDTFETKTGAFLDYQIKNYNLSQDEALGLGYYGKEFAKKELLNKYVKAEYTAKEKFDKNNRHLMSIYYDCNKNGICKNYEQEVLKAGLATVYKQSNIADQLKPYENIDKIKACAKKSHRLNLVVLNKKTGKYHKTSCKYGWMASQQELIKKPMVKYSPASCCLKKYKKDNYSIDLMFNYPFYKLPSSIIRTPAAKVLYHELSNEKKSLDFMMYGIYKQPDIFNQIVLLCNNSNVAVRGIVDVNTKGENDYPDTHKLKMMCKYVKTDFSQRDEMQDYYDKKKKLGYLMHNKVFVFSNNHVWTGSTNISSTCSGGFNANVSYLIKDSRVADLYRKEISQMYNEEKFHIDKEKIFQRNLLLEDGTVLDVYFAPNEDILNEAIIPSIHNAQKTIYVAMFYFTNKQILEELIKANKRGLDVKVIVDASFAKDFKNDIALMRNSGIKVKVENWAGKMHCKLAVIDNKITLTGSLNWTNSAINFNDENFLKIQNERIANETIKYFNVLWKSIPDKWLYDTPSAEGIESRSSCSDGIDNDHNGLTDADDPKCKLKNIY